MPIEIAACDAAVQHASERRALVDAVRRFFEARDHQRRGICLLNARCYERAQVEFAKAARLNPSSASLHELLTECSLGRGQYRVAASHLKDKIDHDSDDVTAQVRRALALFRAGSSKAAVASLRASIAKAPNCAELHFQLGTMLASMNEREEAELRFVTAVTLDAHHAEAQVSLAMCFAARQESGRALRCLRKAQMIKPDDPRIGQLLAQAGLAASDAHCPDESYAVMPDSQHGCTAAAVASLSEVIERDPEFVDAFLALRPEQLNRDVYDLLLATIRKALERQPQLADLHYHYGCVLARLGHCDRAIESLERAVSLNPRFVRALIDLAKLYQQTSRNADAKTRLEETLRLGADYADVHLLLGNLYRAEGAPDRARDAYRRALDINGTYRAAQEALEGLSA